MHAASLALPSNYTFATRSIHRFHSNTENFKESISIFENRDYISFILDSPRKPDLSVYTCEHEVIPV